MLNKILLPLDGSTLADCVLPHTTAVAQAMGAEVTLLHVLEKSTGQLLSPVDWQLRKMEAQVYLDNVRQILQKKNLSAHNILLEGRAAERIVEYAEQEEMDLVIVSSHGEGGLTGWSISSVGQKIIHRAFRSVMLVRAYEMSEPNITYKRILIPLDGSQRAESVLPVAIKLANYHGAQLVLAHVIMQPEILDRTPLSIEDTQLIEEVVTRNEKKAKNYLNGLKQRLPLSVETKLLVGEDITAVLHDFVKEDGIDLVILNAHGRSANQQRPYGNLVTNFITYGATPLLIFQDLSFLEPTEAKVMGQENLSDTRPLTAPIQSQPFELATGLMK